MLEADPGARGVGMHGRESPWLPRPLAQRGKARGIKQRCPCAASCTALIPFRDQAPVL